MSTSPAAKVEESSPFPVDSGLHSNLQVLSALILMWAVSGLFSLLSYLRITYTYALVLIASTNIFFGKSYQNYFQVCGSSYFLYFRIIFNDSWPSCSIVKWEVKTTYSVWTKECVIYIGYFYRIFFHLCTKNTKRSESIKKVSGINRLK